MKYLDDFERLESFMSIFVDDIRIPTKMSKALSGGSIQRILGLSTYYGSKPVQMASYEEFRAQGAEIDFRCGGGPNDLDISTWVKEHLCRQGASVRDVIVCCDQG